MEDLTFYIERAKDYFLDNKIPSRKSLDFMDCLVVAMMESLDWDIHLMEVAYLRLNFFRLLVEFLSCGGDVITVLQSSPCQTETNRDPPSVFIPIPKLVESSSCARSDLNLFAYF